MTTFYFKAYTTTGYKSAGTIVAFDPRAADVELRERGLRPYFIRDLITIRNAHRARKRRQRIIFSLGAVAILAASIGAGLLVRYAGRVPELGFEDYKRLGLVTEGPEQFVAKSDEALDFAQDIHEIWNSFYPGVIERIEAHKMLLTIHVTSAIGRIPRGELETLLTNTVSAHHRRFQWDVSTLVIVEDGVPFVEAKYNTYSGSVRFDYN
ncbi:MAG: hypothetical protein AAB353_13455 [Candidatus Hydrogenedentota bacterium]